MTTLPDACADAAAWLPRAAALITEPDADGTQGGSRPGSAPPWNSAAANAYFDARIMIWDILDLFTLMVTGHSAGQRRWSDRAIYRALDAIGKLSHAVPQQHYREDGRPCQCAYCRSGRDLSRRMTVIKMLPAIDEAERGQRVLVPCPYCEVPMMRLFPRAGLVVCLRGGFACWDGDGNPPKGHARNGRLGPQIEWEDGLVT